MAIPWSNARYHRIIQRREVQSGSERRNHNWTPLASGVVIVGLGGIQPALLIEVRDEGGKQTHSLIEAILPTVEQANAQAPDYARVTRSMIAVADTNKRFDRAGKGTVIRKLAAEKFTCEIEALYTEENL